MTFYGKYLTKLETKIIFLYFYFYHPGLPYLAAIIFVISAFISSFLSSFFLLYSIGITLLAILIIGVKNYITYINKVPRSIILNGIVAYHLDNEHFSISFENVTSSCNLNDVRKWKEFRRCFIMWEIKGKLYVIVKRDITTNELTEIREILKQNVKVK